ARLAKGFVAVAVYHGAGAVTAEQLFQQRAVLHVADDVRARYAVAPGPIAGTEVKRQNRAVLSLLVKKTLAITQAELPLQFPLVILDARLVGKGDQLVGLEGDRHFGGDLVVGEIENFPGQRVAQAGDEHNRARL